MVQNFIVFVDSLAAVKTTTAPNCPQKHANLGSHVSLTLQYSLIYTQKRVNGKAPCTNNILMCSRTTIHDILQF